MHAFLTIAFLSLLYLLLEWIFFVTKPSFLSGHSFYEQTLALVQGSAMAMSLFLLPLILLALVSKRFNNKTIQNFISLAPQVLILATMLLMLLLNFTATVFGFNLLRVEGILKIPTTLLFALLIMQVGKKLRVLQASVCRWPYERFFVFTFLVVCPLLTMLLFVNAQLPIDLNVQKENLREPLPHIVFLSTDALDASATTVYDNSKDTTPYLSEFSKRMLVFENVFSNANRSAGSIVSMLTGRSPFDTKLLTYPEILLGTDSYKHLLSYLRPLGYKAIDYSIRYYADATDLNLRNGFHHANSRNMETIFHNAIEKFPKVASSLSWFFLEAVFDRIQNLYSFLFTFSSQDNPFVLVTQSGTTYERDSLILEDATRLINSAKNPYFIHIHLLGTHGPFYSARVRLSENEKLGADIETPSYFDAVSNFDFLFEKFISDLEKSGAIENTIIVVHSDHSSSYTLNERIPLLFYFPKTEFVGRMKENVQLLDISPTILSYLGVTVPSWMEGQSLINTQLNANRAIFSGSDEFHNAQKQNLKFGPKKNSLRYLNIFSVAVCNKFLKYRVDKDEFEFGEIKGHSDPCDEAVLPSNEDLIELLKGRLKAKHFNL